jgi:hypothetical protein
MKIILIVVMSLSFVSLYGQRVDYFVKADSTHSVSVQMNKGMYILGEPIVAQITYCNNNPSRDWKFARPDSNATCVIRYIHALSERLQNLNGFNGFITYGGLNKETSRGECIMPTLKRPTLLTDIKDEAQNGYIIDPNRVDTICLKPHETYIFKVDIMLKMNISSMMPGKITVKGNVN